MTPAQIKTKLIAEGTTIKEWATKRGFQPGAVSHVLNGMNKGRRGNAHLIAVALGIKPTQRQTNVAERSV